MGSTGNVIYDLRTYIILAAIVISFIAIKYRKLPKIAWDNFGLYLYPIFLIIVLCLNFLSRDARFLSGMLSFLFIALSLCFFIKHRWIRLALIIISCLLYLNMPWFKHMDF